MRLAADVAALALAIWVLIFLAGTAIDLLAGPIGALATGGAR
jgi:hypothetical protein